MFSYFDYAYLFSTKLVVYHHHWFNRGFLGAYLSFDAIKTSYYVNINFVSAELLMNLSNITDGCYWMLLQSKRTQS